MKARKTPQEQVDIVIEYNIGAFEKFCNQHEDDAELGKEIREIVYQHTNWPDPDKWKSKKGK